MSNDTNLTLSSDLDQDIFWKVTKMQENKTHNRAKRSALSQKVTTRLQGIDRVA